MPANPEAIAWYVQRSEALLGELTDRVQAIRSRGEQVAGFAGAVLALAGTNADTALASLDGGTRLCAGGCLLLGFALLIAAFATALGGALRVPQIAFDLSAEEVANYATDRFVQEPDLWRVHLRTVKGLVSSIESTTRSGDRAARAVRKAERFFVAGLSSVGMALAILVFVEMLR